MAHDQAKLRKQRQRGQQAKRLLDDPLIAGFFDQVERAAIRRWTNSAPHEQELRECAYYRLQALGDLRLCFTETIANGKLAEDDLFRMHKESKT